MKVFGIGLNKTGTKTLGDCFKAFGFNNKTFDMHLLNEFSKQNFDVIFKSCDLFDSFEDWPWPLLYKELDRRYPSAKFILTTRKSPQIWFESLCSHADKTGPTEARRIAYKHSMPHDHKEFHIDLYNRHNEEVTLHFSDRNDKLLQVCWENGDGWEQLCSFLKLPIPHLPFPHTNKRPQIFSQNQ